LAELIAMRSIPAAAWMRKLALAAVILGFTVVVLGAYVRLTAAGLGCPDWPGCYGHLTPLGAERSVAEGIALPGAPLNVTKAWHEMIHRYAASTLGLLIVFIAALGVATRHESATRARYAVALLGIVVVQGVLGMLTVTWQLTPAIVTLHLLFGMTTLALLWWLWLSLRAAGPPSPSRQSASGSSHAAPAAPRPMRSARRSRSATRVRRLAIVALIVVGVQIALGGWTSSNYAAVACPDFPTCQGSWWPRMDYHDAFVFWRPLGIDYQGGVLSSPARVAIHFTHRMGALVTACVLLAAALAVLSQRSFRASRRAAVAVMIALATQLSIGISMVLRGFPLWLATAHNAGAALTLLAVIALVHSLRGAPLLA
jgi:heme a synthase